MDMIKNAFLWCLEKAGMYTPDVANDDLGAFEGERTPEDKEHTRQSMAFLKQVEDQINTDRAIEG